MSDHDARVLHFSPFVELSGANRSMLALLAELASRQPTFAVVLEDGELAEHLLEAGVTVRSVFGGAGLPVRRWQRWSRIVRVVRQAVSEWGIGIVHCHSAMGNRYTWPALWGTKGGLVTHQRDVYHFDYFHLGLGRADHLIAVSNWVKEGLPARLQRKATVIYNTVALPDIEEIDSAEQDGTLTVGMAGRCTEDKGADIFLEAALSVAEDLDLRVILWGVPARNTLSAFAESLWNRLDACPEGVQSRVRFEPFRPDIDSFFRETDIVVVPSRFGEAFGRMALEAMAWRRPVLVAGHGGLLEIVANEKTGLTFPPGDPEALAAQLGRLVGNADLREELAAEGRAEVANRFAPSGCADAVLGIYRKQRR